MDEVTREFVRSRAADVCEYCRLPQRLYWPRFQIEHVVAVQHGGGDRPDNLALACPQCNRHKGPNLAGIDPDTGRLTRLFHPRHDAWEDHFAWSGHILIGRTDIGRTTVAVLNMNSPAYRTLRAVLMFEGLFPP